MAERVWPPLCEGPNKANMARVYVAIVKNKKDLLSNDCGEMQIVLRLFESRAKVSYWVAIS